MVPQAINHPGKGRSDGNGWYLFRVIFIKLVIEGTSVTGTDRVGRVVDHSALLFAEDNTKHTKDEAVNKMEEPAVNVEGI